jgi:hypothetical protein
VPSRGWPSKILLRSHCGPAAVDGTLWHMAFKVKYLNNVEDKYTDEDTYDVTDGGVLKVIYRSGDGKRHIYPPWAWVTLRADESHRPGGLRIG